MLQNLSQATKKLTVIRLSAVGNTAIVRLLNRNISPGSFPEILARMREQNIVFEPAQLIDKIFRPSVNPNHPTPFAPSRFTDGNRAVFYSALEDETSIEEIKYHQTQRGEFNDLQTKSTAPPRYYCLFETNFYGTVLDLNSIHSDCPELTSQNESGYPKCRQLAEEARISFIDALVTPSARRQEGTNCPVFDRQSLADVPTVKMHGRFINENGKIVFRKL